MNYDAIFQRAREIAAQRMQSGEQLMQDDTVCVICSASDTLYTGCNRRASVNGMLHNNHAEVEAIRNMQKAGEAAIRQVLLISVANGMPLLPCDQCLRNFLSIHPDNIRCEIMMHDRAVPITEFIERLRHPQAAHSAQLPPQQSLQHPVRQSQGIPKAEVQEFQLTSVSAPQDGANEANLLRNRVNSLLAAADELDEEEAEEKAAGKKGLFGGLFRKK